VDFEDGFLYRLAHQFHEARRFSAQTGRHRNNAEAGGGLDALLAEVVKQLRLRDPRELELARGAVEDAVEGRRPRW
jgi:hypothetical protein